jgi:hypothetical protein
VGPTCAINGTGQMPEWWRLGRTGKLVQMGQRRRHGLIARRNSHPSAARETRALSERSRGEEGGQHRAASRGCHRSLEPAFPSRWTAGYGMGMGWVARVGSYCWPHSVTEKWGLT